MAEHLVSINPATNKKIGTYNVLSEKSVDKALRNSLKTFEEWHRLPFNKRATLLKNIARHLRKDCEELALLATTEMGKPIQQSRDEVEKCAKALEFYASEGAKYLANEMAETDARKSYVTFQPLGVILAVMPWNFPYWQVFRAMAPAVMAGNVMLLKHASNVSGCALAIERIIIAAGAPVGLFQTLILPSSRIDKLIDNPVVAAITLTGSTNAGSKVAKAAGRNLKKCVLELGGSDAYIILDDADMDVAVEIALRGRLVNTGQSCIAAKRFVVLKSRRKEFEQRYTEQMTSVTYGDPMDSKNRMGPMARIDLRDELHSQVVKSIENGAKLLCGGFVPDGPGAFYPATVLTNVKKGMPAYDEELFGPVAAIIEAKDEKDAIRIANDTIYGLAGGIISRNRTYAEKLAAEEFQAGNCYVNDFAHSDPRLPFGGIKHSGYGRELSSFGIREFVNIKTVFVK